MERKTGLVMKTDLMFSTNPSPREAKTKQQTKKPYSNHVEQLSTQNTTGKKEVSEAESTPAAYTEKFPFSLQVLGNNGSVTFFFLCSKYHDTNTGAARIPTSDFTV